MSIRYSKSIGLAVLIACITAVAVSAKGGFSFITISGGDAAEVLRTSDIALTEDFFAFADFYRDRAEAPVDPGIGYEITRYYIDGEREIAFDRLHYYPATGFVYYDGIVNGSSEYDKKWYAAKPEIRSLFESALVGIATNQLPKISSEEDVASEPVTALQRPNTVFDRMNSMPFIAIAAALALSILIFFSRHRFFLNH